MPATLFHILTVVKIRVHNGVESTTVHSLTDNGHFLKTFLQLPSMIVLQNFNHSNQ